MIDSPRHPSTPPAPAAPIGLGAPPGTGGSATVNLLDLAPDSAWREVEHLVGRAGHAAYRTRQVFPYLWQRPLAAWSDATDLPRDLVELLEREAPIRRLHLVTRQVSRDGTVKVLWRLEDGMTIESVWIPEARRRTLCISSQVGCAFGCRFCATGRMGFQRHLAPWEITAQVREMALDPDYGRPSNVVFMGMGEPLHNWPAVDRALTILNDARGMGIGARRITVSTVGLVPQLERLARRPEQFRLAVSLHGAIPERRAALMPVERKYGIAALTGALKRFARRVTLEYVVIRGANDEPEDARALAQIAIPLGAMVNLLPLHPGGTSELVPADPDRIARFAGTLRALGVNVTVRRSRGLDISAACGQLRTEAARGSGVHPQDHRHVEE